MHNDKDVRVTNRHNKDIVKGDRAMGESADISGAANSGLRCIGMKQGDPDCKLALVNLNGRQFIADVEKVAMLI